MILTEGKVGGYMGKILRVNLTNGEVTRDTTPEDVLRRYVGGEGLGTRLIAYEVPAGVGPLEPENRVSITTGPLTAAPCPGGSAFVVASKSPATGFTLMVSRCQGFFGPELKAAGFDAIILSGRASKPVYLYVHDGAAELNDASHLWGRETHETEDMIKDDLGDQKARVACIGPAGENLVCQACIISDKHHAAGRGGLGAVWGSKNLKAVAASGEQKVAVARPDELRTLHWEWLEELKQHPAPYDRKRYGTAGLFEMVHSFGDLPIMNFSRGVLPGHERLDGKYLRDQGMVVRDEGCYGCPFPHDKWLRVKEGIHAGLEAPQYEYEGGVAMGSLLGVTDPNSAIYGNDLCNRLGLDVISAGNSIAFAMECYEKGILSNEDTGGLQLQWGNAEEAYKMVEKIAKRKGLGDILAMDVKRASEYIGNGSEQFAVHVKGMSSIMHDYRAFWGYALQYAVSAAGPIHEGGGSIMHRALRGDVPRFDVKGQAPLLKEMQAIRGFMNCTGVCEFLAPAGLKHLAKAVSCVTGWDMDEEEARRAALRELNLRRIFALENGLKPEDDTLPPRQLEAPSEGGAKGSRILIRPLVREYYSVMGWDEKTGKPYRSTLKELGLEEFEKQLWS